MPNAAIDGLSRCTVCGLFKPTAEFHRRGAGAQWWCKACKKTWDRAYHARTKELRRQQRQSRRASLVARMRQLKAIPCMDCGRNFHFAAMTFDHREGTRKERDIATLAQRGLTGLFELEVAKCDVVCANCHALRTFTRREAERATRRIGESEARYHSAA